MRRNVEIKARVGDLTSLRKRVQEISDSAPTVIHQEDTFFECPRGRLKVRRVSDAYGELIYYERRDSREARESRYVCSTTLKPGSLIATLAQAYGIRGVVRKRRSLYLMGQTRIHLDEVEGLGDFVELEVVLSTDQSVNQGVRIVQEIMERLGIPQKNLVDQAYIDLLTRPPAERVPATGRA